MIFTKLIHSSSPALSFFEILDKQIPLVRVDLLCSSAKVGRGNLIFAWSRNSGCGSPPKQIGQVNPMAAVWCSGYRRQYGNESNDVDDAVGHCLLNLQTSTRNEQNVKGGT